VVLVFFALIIAVSIIAFNRQGDDMRDELRQRTAAPTGSPTIPPTAAPTQFLWIPLGDDITPPTGLARSGDGFGAQVILSHSGTRVAISAPRYNESKGWVGVYEYTLRPMDVGSGANNTTTVMDNVFADEPGLVGAWLLIGEALVGDAPGDAIGMSIHLSADGTTLAVSFPGNGKGYVRIYRYEITVGAWKQLGQTLEGKQDGEGFGASVSMTRHGDSVAIGSPYYNDAKHNFEACGRVAGFDLVRSRWVQLGGSVVGQQNNARLGHSLCMADDGRLFVSGAPFDSSQFTEAGIFFSFIFGPDAEDMLTEVGVDKTDLNVSDKSYQQLLTAVSGDTSYDHFGAVLACDSDANSVVSSAIEDDQVRLYTVGGVRWIRSGHITPDDSDGKGNGHAMDISPRSEVIVTATRNYNGTVGQIFNVIPVGFSQSYAMGQTLGGDEILGQDDWIRDGPSVSLGEEGVTLAIGYESILLLDDDYSNAFVGNQSSLSVVRVYSYGSTTSSFWLGMDNV